MSLERKIDYDYNVLMELGKHFDFLKVKTKKKGPDCSSGIAVNLFWYKVDVYVPVKRQYNLPDGTLTISVSSDSLVKMYTSHFVNLFDLLAKVNTFNQLYKDFEKVYKPYHNSRCAKVEGGKMIPGAKVTFPTQSETETAEKEFFAEVNELNHKYSGEFN